MKLVPVLRFFVRLVVYGFLALGVLLFTSGWWLPWLLPGVLKQFEVELESVARMEGGGMRVSGLSYADESIELDLDGLSLPSLPVYLWELSSGDFPDFAQIEASYVELRLKDGESAGVTDAGRPVGPGRVVRTIQSQLAWVDSWVPQISVERFAVYSQSGALVADARDIRRHQRELDLQLEGESLPGRVRIDARLEAGVPWTVGLSLPEVGLRVDATLEPVGEGLRVDAVVSQGESELCLAAEFEGDVWIPQLADVSSSCFELRREWFPAVEGVSFDAMMLRSLGLHWDGREFSGALRGDTELDGGVGGPQTATLDLRVEGDRERVRILQALLTSAMGEVSLSRPFAIHFRDWSVEGDAELSAHVDLSRQDFVDASGVCDAEFRIGFNDTGSSAGGIDFTLSGTDLRYLDYTAQSVVAAGWFDRGRLRLDRLELQPARAGGDERLSASGMIDFREGSLAVAYEASLGAEWLNAMVGQPYWIDVLNVTDGRVSGTFSRPVITGRLRTGLQSAVVEPVELDGVFRIEGSEHLDWKGRARCNGAEIFADFSADLDARSWLAIRINELSWTDPVRPRLDLVEPAQFRFALEEDGLRIEERLLIDSFSLVGEDLRVTGAFTPEAGLRLDLHNVSLARVDRWVRRDLPEYEVDAIRCAITEFRPYVRGELDVELRENLDEHEMLDLELSAQLESAGINLTRVAVDFSGQSMLRGNVALPLQVQLPDAAGGGMLKPVAGGLLLGQLRGEMPAEFSGWLERLTGTSVESARVDMELAGDLSKPVGTLNLQVRDLQFDRPLWGRQFPLIQKIDLSARSMNEWLELEHFAFSMNQSQIEGSFKLPLDPVLGLLDEPEIDLIELLSKGAGQVQLVDWRMENWADMLPPMLRQSGVFNGSLRVEPGFQLEGELTFSDFALRPTQTMPSVDMIGGNLRLSGRMLTIGQASGRVGGSPVELKGWIDAADPSAPLWEFDLRGLNVPIVRTTDMILRTDLDLKASGRDPSVAPLLSGVLNLRSSTLLVEFDPLAPSVEKGPGAKPPFFRITEEPFADWRFDLKAVGDAFMRVRSPYFKTQLSANFQLKGTFGEPELLGSVRTVEGELYFPGAKFLLDEGEAYIEPSRPDVVQLNFSGVAHKASKVITMEVSQTLDDPQIQFQSTPPMSNAAIVRFLATGSTSGGGLGNVGLYIGQGVLGAGGFEAGFVDRLSVDVGADTTRSGRNTLDVRYDLSDSWSIEGEYDVYDAYNADLIWSIFKR